jgi:Domain of unknown function (DUF4365)
VIRTKQRNQRLQADLWGLNRANSPAAGRSQDEAFSEMRGMLWRSPRRFATIVKDQQLTRPPQHEIDDKGDALFRLRFAEWGVNPSEKDYGWDYVVELFSEHKSTGHLLAAQLKSSASTPYSKDQTFISEPLETPAADYLARQLKLPTFLFHADVLTNRLFWTAIQLDAAVLAKLEKGETKSLTVRIPTANVLPDRFDNFLRDLRDVKFALLTKELMGTDNTRFVAAVSDQGPDLVQDVVDDLHEKAFRLELQTAHDIFRRGRLAEAIERLRSLLQNPVASVPIRFNATRNLGQYEWIEIFRSDKPQILAAEKLVATAKELCKIAGDGPSSLRLGAIMMRLAAELGVLVHSYFSALMLWRAHSLDGGDAAWLTILTFRLSNALPRSKSEIQSDSSAHESGRAFPVPMDHTPAHYGRS